MVAGYQAGSLDFQPTVVSSEVRSPPFTVGIVTISGPAENTHLPVNPKTALQRSLNGHVGGISNSAQAPPPGPQLQLKDHHKEPSVFFLRSLSTLLSGCLVTALGLWPVTASAFSAPASKFTVSQPVEIPGLTLRPGSYSIHVIDHLSERYIVRIDGPNHRVHSTFLALADPASPKPDAPGKELWQNAPSGKEYMRGWLFPGQPTVLEFVYPKSDAVAIAKSNNAKVPAIDPVSEGRPPTIRGLSRTDLELVTLWLLSSTTVGPGDSSAGIQAERYPEVAQAAAHKPAISRLPQTASYLPWIGLLGAFSLVMAFFMRFLRAPKLRRAEVERNHTFKLPSCATRNK